MRYFQIETSSDSVWYIKTLNDGTITLTIEVFLNHCFLIRYSISDYVKTSIEESIVNKISLTRKNWYKIIRNLLMSYPYL